jgi:hypothetical protein
MMSNMTGERSDCILSGKGIDECAYVVAGAGSDALGVVLEDIKPFAGTGKDSVPSMLRYSTPASEVNSNTF